MILHPLDTLDPRSISGNPDGNKTPSTMNVADPPIPPATQEPVDPRPQEPEENEMTYEEQRLATIRANEQLLKELGLLSAPAVPRPHPAPASSGTPKRTVPKRVAPSSSEAGPVRKSARISAVQARETRPSVTRNPSSLTSLSDAEPESASEGRTNAVLPPGERLRLPIRSVQYAPGQEDYSVVQPWPRREAGGKGRLVFPGAFERVFVPNLTPEDVLRGGAFGGNYYADTYSSVLKRGLSGEEDVAALPAEWVREEDEEEAGRMPFRIATHLTAPERDPTVNRYGVAAGQGLKEWEKSGWIWQGDPRGWMQWYVRFYQGRRCEDDERQVQRWLNLAGPTGRFSRMLMKKIAQHPGSGGAVVDNTAVEDEDVGRVLRQVCWQWGLVMDREEWRRRIEGGGL